jgi:hypothetical protein
VTLDLFILCQLLLLPPMLVIWYGLYLENRRRRRYLRDTLHALGIIATTRGRTWR